MAGRLRKLFTDEDLIGVLSKHSNSEAAIILGKSRGVNLSAQSINYWRECLSHTKSNGDKYKTSLPEDRKIRDGMQLKNRCVDEESRAVDNSCILIIPDLHAPYHHPDSLKFLLSVAERYKPTRIISLGDETDGHALSFHDSDPNLDSAGTELTMAREFLHELASYFSTIDVCHSNHGSLIYRRAIKAGIPVEYIKSYRDIIFPNIYTNWVWADVVLATLPNGLVVQFKHQIQGDIMHSAAHERTSVVLGHKHSEFNLQYKSNGQDTYFGMYSGCLVDREALAFAYGKHTLNKPVLGCSVISNSQPILVPMELHNQRWTGELNGPDILL